MGRARCVEVAEVFNSRRAPGVEKQNKVAEWADLMAGRDVT
jgi:hypothetical protein